MPFLIKSKYSLIFLILFQVCKSASGVSPIILHLVLPQNGSSDGKIALTLDGLPQHPILLNGTLNADSKLQKALYHTVPGDGSCNLSINSDQHKEGTVVASYRTNSHKSNVSSVRCLVKFEGSLRENVQVAFTYFNLPDPPLGLSQHERCLYTDSVVLFNKGHIGNMQEIERFCGSELPLPVMSTGPELQLAYTMHMAEDLKKNKDATKTSLRNQEQISNRVFSFTFRFTTDFGILNGEQKSVGTCHFYYKSSESLNGSIYSPNPEGIYPKDTTCHYYFQGRNNEVVRILFKYFDVEGRLPCDQRSDSDWVEFSNFPTPDRKMPAFCGPLAPTTVQSDSSFFRLTFRSNSKFDGTGFAADYQFLDLSRQPHVIKRVVGTFSTAPGGEILNN
ncbi:unnamed protein product [Meganyctiphanes norvegica]|uniref:CUB domain-containing protein n=1 Tax=Meganyctiphanes norvegica TaxID=48144 RepID=A0AAV2PRC7_MEGNR